MAGINVNTDELIVFTNKLQKLSSTAFPNAVRKTLNETALDMKKRTLPKSADDTFTVRQPNFFKAFSRVNFAQGKDVNAMKSEVGFVEQGLKGGNNYSIKDLEQQEFGGSIGGRSLIATDAARVGGSRKKLVKGKNQIRNIKRIFDPKDVSGKSQKERWVKSVIHAGVDGLVKGTYNDNMVFRVRSIDKTKEGTKAKTEAVYDIKKNRSVKVKATKFAEKAATVSAQEMPKRYIAEAEKRFLK